MNHLLAYLRSDHSNVRACMARLPLERMEQGTRFFNEHDAVALCRTFFAEAPAVPFPHPPPGLSHAVEHWESEWDSFDGAFDAQHAAWWWSPAGTPRPGNIPLRGMQVVHSGFWEREVHPMAAGGSGVRAARLVDVAAGSLLVFSLGTHARVFHVMGHPAWRSAAMERLR